MIYLFQWIFGFVKFEFSGGFFENFINDCFNSGIEIRDVELCDNGFTACCRINTYKRLHHIAYKHGGKVKIIKKRGLPFVLHPLKNRIGFLAGAVAFAFIISFLGGFIWNVEIVGNERISDTAIRAYLNNNHLSEGVMWGGIDRSRLSWQMMSDFDDLAWVHINKIGTTARVEVNETRQAPIGNETKLKGIKVIRKELQAVAYRQQSNISVKDKKSYKRLIFFSADIPLYFKSKVGDIEEEKEVYLTIKDTALPIGYKEKQELWLTSSPYDLSDGELLALAKKKLAYNEQREFDGYEIINKNISYKIDKDKCIITGAYVVREKQP